MQHCLLRIRPRVLLISYRMIRGDIVLGVLKLAALVVLSALLGLFNGAQVLEVASEIVFGPGCHFQLGEVKHDVPVGSLLEGGSQRTEACFIHIIVILRCRLSQGYTVHVMALRSHLIILLLWCLHLKLQLI